MAHGKKEENKISEEKGSLPLKEYPCWEFVNLLLKKQSFSWEFKSSKSITGKERLERGD